MWLASMSGHSCGSESGSKSGSGDGSASGPNSDDGEGDEAEGFWADDLASEEWDDGDEGEPPADWAITDDDNLRSSNIESDITPEDLGSIRHHFNLLVELKLMAPRGGKRVYSPHIDYFPVYMRYLFCGMKLPPHPLWIEICNSLGIGIAQFVPNVVLLSRDSLPRWSRSRLFPS